MPEPGPSKQGSNTEAQESSLWDETERRRRAAIVAALEERISRDGPHVARAHPDRARQFMPFAALKGYHELVEQKEREAQERSGTPSETYREEA